MKRLSLTFRLFKKLGLAHNEEKYGNISPFKVVWLILKIYTGIFKRTLKRLTYGYCYFGLLFNNANKMWLRAWLWRRIGAHVGKNVHIYHRVALDYLNANYLFIEDNVSIANGCTILCHMRKFEDYRYAGDFFRDLPFIHREIHLKKGCTIGMNAMIMPGVTVGEGAVVGAYSFVTKDVPPWTVVVGNPARPIRQLPLREGAEEANTLASK